MWVRHHLQAFALAAMLAGAAAQSQELLFSPNLGDIAAHQFGITPSGFEPGTAVKQEDALRLLPPSYWLGTGLNGITGQSSTFRSLREASPQNGSAIPNNQFRWGGSYFDLQTQKTIQTFGPLRQSGCETDEECAEYMGLPKSSTPNDGPLKGIKKPYLGLSIITPLQDRP